MSPELEEIPQENQGVETGAPYLGKPATKYDPTAKNRFAYTVTENGQKYDTAHVFKGEQDDVRYLQWMNEFNAGGNDDEVKEEVREASVRYWDDIIGEVENIEVVSGQDWKALIPEQEKQDGLNDYLAVAIGEDEQQAGGKRQLGQQSETQTVYTEAFFNGEVVKQKHVLQKSSIEFKKKYSRIQQKQYKQETAKGLRRKPKIQFVPQDEAFGKLYDEMFIEAEGFENSDIRLRFKTTVIHHVFAPTLETKK